MQQAIILNKKSKELHLINSTKSIMEKTTQYYSSRTSAMSTSLNKSN